MPFDNRLAFVFSESSVRRNAPVASGVFGLSNSMGWLLVEESDDIQASLLEVLDGQPRGASNRRPTGFSFEVLAVGQRSPRCAALVRELKPVGNS